MEHPLTHNSAQHDRWGTSRYNQLLPMLLPESAPIDERKPEDFLVFARRFSTLLQYYDSENKPAGDWSLFFEKDISLFLAAIAFRDGQKIISRRDRLLMDISNARQEADQIRYLFSFMELSWGLVRDMDDWYRWLEDSYVLEPGDKPEILRELETLIKGRLNTDRVKLDGYTREIRRKISEDGSPPPMKATEMHDVWKTVFLPLIFKIDADKTQKEKVDFVLKYIQLVFQSFLNAYLQVIELASKYLKDSLENNANHSPDIGLYLTFIHLYKHLQEDLNKLTEEHLDLYYKKILLQEPYPAIPDEVNVQVIVASDVEEGVYIEAGTLLNAGTRNEVPTFYEVVEDTFLNRASIEQVKTVFVAKNPKLGTGSTYRLVSNIYTAPIANSKDGQGSPMARHESWPTFGEDQLLKPEDDQRMIPAEIGLAISDPILMLGEGERTIIARMQFSEESYAILDTLMQDISKKQGIGKEDAFSQYFQNALSLYLTTEEKWYELTYYNLKPTLGPFTHELQLTIGLISSDPPIVPWHEELEGEPFDTPWPVLKVLLNPEATPFAYSFLRDLILEDIYLEVKVRKMKQLDVFNEFGKLDNSQPFQPFGQLPSRGSYFLFGKPELFNKKLTKLDVNLRWHNLPLKQGGLTEHYAPYELGITNESFQVNLSVLTENEFSPPKIKDRPVYPLFAPLNPRRFPPEYEDDRKLALGIERPLKTPPPPLPSDAEENDLDNQSSFEDIDLKELGFYPDFSLKSTENFDLSSRSGFFRAELISPNEAFGHQAFPRIFTDVVTENSVNRGLRQLNPFKRYRQREVPEPPYTPTLQSLSVDYEARSRINLQQVEETTIENGGAQVFHIHPFGIRSAYHPQAIISRALMPQFNYDGYLFLGLKDLAPPQILTIYFQMEKNPNYQVSDEPPEIDWDYLSDGQWVSFRKESFISDATHGFTTSGIITLEIPAGMKPDGLIKTEEPLSWIRIAVKGNIPVLSKTHFICAQAMKARWVRNENTSHLDTPLSADSITKLDTTLPEIVELLQPYPSFGGKAEEMRNDFYVRVSERLRHKNRAITNWDIEHLVLSRFPEIHQVKSYSYEKGTVMVVIIPRLDNWDIGAEPKVSYGMLQEVKDYLEEIGSPFTAFQIRNPQYDKIKARCTVVFNEKRDASGLIRQLENDLNRFICPWRFDPQQPLKLGGDISKDAVLKYLNDLPYVKFVTAFALIQIIENEDVGQVDRGDFRLYDPEWEDVGNPLITASNPWSVLVPSTSHLITFSFNEQQLKADRTGIGNLSVETDFIIPGQDDLKKPEREISFLDRGLLGGDAGSSDEDDQYYLTINLD